MSEGLNTRQRKFVREYAKCGVGKQAAIAAGYSEKGSEQQAARLLSNARICEALRELMDQSKKRDIADVAELREFWTRVARGEVNDYDANGVEKPAALRERLKAADLLGKSQGAFLDRVAHTGPDGGPIEQSIRVTFE